MIIIIDRFESDFAVCELPDGSAVKIPRAVTGDCREGDVLRIEKDAEETCRRSEIIKALQESVFDD